MKTVFQFLLAILVTFSTVPALALQTGAAAPDFTLIDQTGGKRSLADAKGKYVVLEWTNPECPFVKKHYDTKNMQKLQKEMIAKGVVWYSVNSSAKGKQGHLTPETALAFLRSQESGASALLLDADGKVGKTYDAKATPHVFVIDPKGTLIYQGAIDDRPSVNPKDVDGATNYVRAAIDEALGGKKVTVATTSAYGCSVKY